MRINPLLAAVAAGALLSGCVTGESVQFSALAGQSALVRDGRPTIVSRKQNSIVLVSPAAREFRPGGRPVFVIAATNLTRAPLDLRVSDIEVLQVGPTGVTASLPVIPYEQLASEERTRQVASALLVGLGAAANSYNASRAGYGTASGTVYTPYGAHIVTANYYSPTAAAIAQANASAQNDAMIANTIENGRRNLAALEATVLKDNSIMPGEWIGGQVHVSPPAGETGQEKHYSITVRLGGDLHVFEVSQAAVTN